MFSHPSPTQNSSASFHDLDKTDNHSTRLAPPTSLPHEQHTTQREHAIRTYQTPKYNTNAAPMWKTQDVFPPSPTYPAHVRCFFLVLHHQCERCLLDLTFHHRYQAPILRVEVLHKTWTGEGNRTGRNNDPALNGKSKRTENPDPWKQASTAAAFPILECPRRHHMPLVPLYCLTLGTVYYLLIVLSNYAHVTVQRISCRRTHTYNPFRTDTEQIA